MIVLVNMPAQLWAIKDTSQLELMIQNSKKTGKCIPNAGWHRDPMSPPFHTNLIWGLRFLQFSVLLPLYNLFSVPCRAIPIGFEDAPCCALKQMKRVKGYIQQKNLPQKM